MSTDRTKLIIMIFAIGIVLSGIITYLLAAYVHLDWCWFTMSERVREGALFVFNVIFMIYSAIFVLFLD